MARLRFNMWSGGEGITSNPATGWAHPIWRLAEVVPIAHGLLSFPHVTSGSVPYSFNPPGTGTTYATPANSLAGAGACLANWVNYYTDQMEAVGIAREYRDYAFFPHGLGSKDEGVCHAYQGATADLLNASYTAYPRYGPFFHNGVEQNRTDAQTVFAALATALDSRGLNHPKYIHNDLEPHYTADAGQATPLLAQPANVTPNGWWNAVAPVSADGANEDARWDQELVYGLGYSLKWLFENTVTDTFDGVSFKRNFADNGAYLPSTATMYQQQNYRFHMWLASIMDLANAYGHNRAFIDPAKTIWPDILYSQYDLRAASIEHPLHGDNKPWKRLHDVLNQTIPFLDFGSPVLYNCRSANFDLNTNGMTGINNIAGWIEVLSHYGFCDPTVTGDDDVDLTTIALGRAKAAITAGVGASPKPMCPWIATPDFTNEVIYDYTGVNPAYGAVNTQHAITKELIQDIVVFGIQNGVYTWNVWYAAPLSAESADAMLEIFEVARTTFRNVQQPRGRYSNGAGLTPTARLSSSGLYIMES